MNLFSHVFAFTNTKMTNTKFAHQSSSERQSMSLDYLLHGKRFTLDLKNGSFQIMEMVYLFVIFKIIINFDSNSY